MGCGAVGEKLAGAAAPKAGAAAPKAGAAAPKAGTVVPKGGAAAPRAGTAAPKVGAAAPKGGAPAAAPAKNEEAGAAGAKPRVLGGGALVVVEEPPKRVAGERLGAPGAAPEKRGNICRTLALGSGMRDSDESSWDDD